MATPIRFVIATEIALTADMPPTRTVRARRLLRLAAGIAAMTRLGLRPYRAGDDPAPGSVPVSVVVLTRTRNRTSAAAWLQLAWADQVVVVDSGSTDGTVRSRAHSAPRSLSSHGSASQPSASSLSGSPSSDMTGSISWTPTSGSRHSSRLEIAARLCSALVRRIRPPAPACVPGHLDPALRLV